MKKCVKLAIILATTALGAPAFANPQSVPGSAPVVPSPAVTGVAPEQGQIQIHSEADFEQPLAQLGLWMDVGGGTRGWRPKEVGFTWRPYVNGRWIWTDAGWFWSSSEPWAWATYHYGTWINIPASGWVWFPGTQWAPAWVSWRMGGSFIGWAPFAPAGANVAPAAFVFVDVHRFNGPLTLGTVVKDNDRILNETQPIGGNRRERRNIQGGGEQEVVFNEGPSVDAIEKTTGEQIRPVPVTQLREETQRSAGQINGRENTTGQGGRENLEGQENGRGNSEGQTNGTGNRFMGGTNTPGNTMGNTNYTPTGRPGGQLMPTPTNEPTQRGQSNFPSGTVPPDRGFNNQPPLTNSTPNFPQNGNLPPTGRPGQQLPPATVPPTVPPANNLPNNQPPLNNSTPNLPGNGNVPPNGPVTPQLPPNNGTVPPNGPVTPQLPPNTTPQTPQTPPTPPPPTPVVPRGTGG